jgi:hypothetical protein
MVSTSSQGLWTGLHSSVNGGIETGRWRVEGWLVANKSPQNESLFTVNVYLIRLQRGIVVLIIASVIAKRQVKCTSNCNNIDRLRKKGKVCVKYFTRGG